MAVEVNIKFDLVKMHWSLVVILSLLSYNGTTWKSAFQIWVHCTMPVWSLFPNGSIYINLRLYYDYALRVKLHNNDQQVHDYLLALVHAAALIYNNRPLNDLGRWHFLVQSIEMIDSSSIKIGPERNGNEYRKRFELYYYTKLLSIGIPYTNLILFTGLNFRHQSNKTDTKGLAIASTGCHQLGINAIIVESRSFVAGMVLAHEIGHGLGIESHDEDVGCGSGHIMSANLGAGKTTFSRCSRTQLIKRFNDIFYTKQYPFEVNCFTFNYLNSVAIFPTDLDLDYRSVSPTDQCVMALGKGFVAQNRVTSSNICSRLTCTNRMVHISIHPALENTTCASHKYCRAGICT